MSPETDQPLAAESEFTDRQPSRRVTATKKTSPSITNVGGYHYIYPVPGNPFRFNSPGTDELLNAAAAADSVVKGHEEHQDADHLLRVAAAAGSVEQVLDIDGYIEVPVRECPQDHSLEDLYYVQEMAESSRAWKAEAHRIALAAYAAATYNPTPIPEFTDQERAMRATTPTRTHQLIAAVLGIATAAATMPIAWIGVGVLEAVSSSNATEAFYLGPLGPIGHALGTVAAASLTGALVAQKWKDAHRRSRPRE